MNNHDEEMDFFIMHPKAFKVFNALIFKEKHLFSDFQNCPGGTPNFDERRRDWLSNVDSVEEKLALYSVLSHLFFVGSEEFKSMLRYAYKKIFLNWLIDKEELMLDDPKLSLKIENAQKHTWFSPISDSADIKLFLNQNVLRDNFDNTIDWLNMVNNTKVNPDFAKSYGKVLKRRLQENNINSIVLIEDFVGTGTQIKKCLRLLRKILPDIRVLVIPYLICPKGVESIPGFEKEFNITIIPVLKISKSSFVSENKSINHENKLNIVYELASSTFDLVSSNQTPAKYKSPYHFLGFGKTGGMTITYKNSPNNSLPLIHNYSDNWKPLFPRRERNFS